MDQLESARGVGEVVDIIFHGAARRHAQNWPDTFATGKQAVPHSLMDVLGRLGLGGNPAVQRGIHQPALLLQIVVDHALAGLKGSACTLAAAPGEDLDARLRLFELFAAGFAELHAFFKQLQRLVEREIA